MALLLNSLSYVNKATSQVQGIIEIHFKGEPSSHHLRIGRNSNMTSPALNRDGVCFHIVDNSIRPSSIIDDDTRSGLCSRSRALLRM